MLFFLWLHGGPGGRSLRRASTPYSTLATRCRMRALPAAEAAGEATPWCPTHAYASPQALPWRAPNTAAETLAGRVNAR